MTTPLPFRRRALIATGIALALALVLWNIDALGFLLYPFRLFVTFVHETGHGLAALITGGQFLGFQVHPNGAGVALTAGGSRALILPAGYLGAAAFGAGLFYIAHRVRSSQTVSVVLGALVILVTVLYTGLLTANFSPLALIVGLALGGGLIWLGQRASADTNLIALNFLAIITALNAVFDLLILIRVGDSASMGGVFNDAAAFSRQVAPILPGSAWALVWAVIAIGLLAWVVWRTIFKRRD